MDYKKPIQMTFANTLFRRCSQEGMLAGTSIFDRFRGHAALLMT